MALVHPHALFPCIPLPVPQGMAERGFLPKVLGYRSRHDTPTLGILLSSIGVMAIATLDFVSIVELLNGECACTPSARFSMAGVHALRVILSKSLLSSLHFTLLHHQRSTAWESC